MGFIGYIHVTMAPLLFPTFDLTAEQVELITQVGRERSASSLKLAISGLVAVKIVGFSYIGVWHPLAGN